MVMITEKITVKGLVQGIGYRPFVAETAEIGGIGGWVRNTNGIVTILASGEEAAVEAFLEKIEKDAPKGACVEQILCERMPYQAYDGFSIAESDRQASQGEIPHIPADLPTCERCLGELRNPENRRYRHPFISCTACGPRYSILEALPYDRETISMGQFPMCKVCEKEYRMQGNIRRHAQTIACPDCGPRLRFCRIGNVDGKNKAPGEQRREGEKTLASAACRIEAQFCEGEAAFAEATTCLAAGGIVAVKDIGGYHLAALPDFVETVAALRRMKRRDTKPFAVMFPNLAAIKECCYVNEKEEQLLLSAPRPIVLLEKRKEAFAENVCGDSPAIGAMLPCNPLQTMLSDALGTLIMTSANGSGELLLLDNDKIQKWMQEQAEKLPVPLGVLEHDREIVTPLDDSVVQVVCNRTQMIRRARGYVPNPVSIPAEKNIFAAGGDLKACFCYTAGGEAFLSQYLGDLTDESCFTAYQEEKVRMQKLFGFAPEYRACDLHPGYLSAQVEKAAHIQHHEAHVASVIAEHNLLGTVLGFAFDGTGYGSDGSIWGSEGFLWDGHRMKRISHLKTIPLVGGDEGARNADTILYGYMASFGEKTRKKMQESGVDTERYQVVEAAVRCGIHTVKSSSMGRLFDAVSAFLDICHYNGYEGEAAIALTNLAAAAEKGYPLSLSVKQEAGQWIGDTEELFYGIAVALENGVKKTEIARGFIDAVADFIYNVTVTLAETEIELRQIAVAGGTFQNRILLERTITLLEEKGYNVFINEQVPPGDGGICLGQAYLCNKSGMEE